MIPTSILVLLISKYIAPNMAFIPSAYILSVISVSPSPFIKYRSNFICLAILDNVPSTDIKCISALCNSPSLVICDLSIKSVAITSFSI